MWGHKGFCIGFSARPGMSTTWDGGIQSCGNKVRGAVKEFGAAKSLESLPKRATAWERIQSKRKTVKLANNKFIEEGFSKPYGTYISLPSAPYTRYEAAALDDFLVRFWSFSGLTLFYFLFLQFGREWSPCAILPWDFHI